MKHVTLPPDPTAFPNAGPGSVFVEFDVDDTHLAPGGNTAWRIVYGPNSMQGRLALRQGKQVLQMLTAANIQITKGG